MTEKDSSTKNINNGRVEEMSTRTLPILALNEVSYSIYHWIEWRLTLIKCTKKYTTVANFCITSLQVFIGESLSSRVSYILVKFDDDQTFFKSRNSGMIVSTGTGSTSWTYNVNKLTNQSVESILRIIFETTGQQINFKGKTKSIRFCFRIVVWHTGH